MENLESKIDPNDGDICLAQCQAACCRNMYFKEIDQVDFEKLSRKAENATELDLASISEVFGDKRSRTGVYYHRLAEDVFDVALVGQCPNLGEKNECTIYEERPEQCSNFPVGGNDCSKARRSLGLPPLNGATEVYPLRFFERISLLFDRGIQ